MRRVTRIEFDDVVPSTLHFGSLLQLLHAGVGGGEERSRLRVDAFVLFQSDEALRGTLSRMNISADVLDVVPLKRANSRVNNESPFTSGTAGTNTHPRRRLRSLLWGLGLRGWAWRS